MKISRFFYIETKKITRNGKIYRLRFPKEAAKNCLNSSTMAKAAMH